MRLFSTKNKKFELNYKIANEILQKIKKICYSLNEEELLDLLEIKPIQGFAQSDPMIITSRGDIINVAKELLSKEISIADPSHIVHDHFGLVIQKRIYEEKIRAQEEELENFSIEDILFVAGRNQKDNERLTSFFIKDRLSIFNWAKINGGTNATKGTAYILLPVNPSKYQLMTIEDFLNTLYERNTNGSVQICIEDLLGNIDIKGYSFQKLFPEEIVDRIKRRISSGRFYENLKEDIGEKSEIEYKGFTIEYFPYTIELEDENLNINSWIIHSPYKLSNSGHYLPLFCENEEGEEINFETLEDAKKYIDKYIVAKKGKVKIKHGDEVHFELDIRENLKEAQFVDWDFDDNGRPDDIFFDSDEDSNQTQDEPLNNTTTPNNNNNNDLRNRYINRVTIIYDSDKNKNRAIANDGINGWKWCAFPNNLRSEYRTFKVGGLRYNGRNYTVQSPIEEERNYRINFRRQIGSSGIRGIRPEDIEDFDIIIVER